MTQFVLQNYFAIVAILGCISALLHLIFLFLGFEDSWSIWAFFGKASALMNVAIVVPLFAALKDPSVFSTLQGADGVVFLAIFVILYAGIQSIVPKYLAAKTVALAKDRFDNNMKSIPKE
ncbi:MAG: hypothetical protein ACRBB0_18375 [Pelagimonas sp.]|uniref:hypothetical protein n=1 Tax=Pelagimonas sp. TaxID=2073170 RepID=UPI003D6C1568